MKKRGLWKRMEEVTQDEQETRRLDDNGAEITIHMENTIWYPEYY
ncbi:MAG: hypothetical protein ACP5OA_04065 [Candidatus Woesearchaeota archaeon]